MELNRERLAFSELVGLPVRDQSGRALGRVYEARAHRDRNGVIVLDGLLVGRRGLWRRLRGPRQDALGIPWETVIELGHDRVVVRR